MDLGLTDRLALISGADSGIGWHTARRLLDEGARVIITDRRQSEVDVALAALDPAPGRARGIAADITSNADIDRLRREVARIGTIDILVQAAGITGAPGLFHEIDEEGWLATLDVDLLGPVRLASAFLPDLRASGHGRLIFLSSEDAVQPYDDELPSCAAKAGILALAKGLSRSYAAEGLLVNCVSPAFIRTPMTDAMMDKRAQELGVEVDQAVQSFLDERRPGLELNRRGEPDEVSAVIAFLCSDLASFVNGSNYRVDAGSVMTL